MPSSADQANALLRSVVDALPKGRLAEQLEAGTPLRVKLGIDPTTADIHLGHCVVLRKLRAFQDAGHIVVLIVGDYTARVGDPSGRSDERPVLAAEQIEANAATYREQAFKILDPDRVELRRNSEWLAMPSDQLFDLMRRFTVARLLERDDFEKRMAAAQPISALELLYPMLQGYDSVAVEADVEVGGSDQTFNLLFGRDVQVSFGVPAQSILTMPLLVGTDGVRKMSKSFGNHIGVAEPPDEMFGKVMSIPDEALPEYYRLLLELDLDSSRRPVEAKRELARRLVDELHGEGEGALAEARFDQVHVRREVPDEVEEGGFAAGADGSVHLPALLADQFGLSRSEARRLLEQEGVRLDGTTLESGTLDVPAEALDGVILQVGKRRFKRLRLER
ncbi:MAG: tyrosyl-tRNA synthetase [Solirubrobacterales bacterium]|nr:tyrosyl-tRNA synthetase [Solirubrobacterales bacterium]